MIYELRIYRALPGRMPALLARFRDHTLRVWQRLGIRQAGFFTTLVGPAGNELTYMLAWDSLAEREAKWPLFEADPEWREVRALSFADGPINATVRHQLLVPTDFSAVR